MKDLEKIAYHLFIRGALSKQEIKAKIRDGVINYYGFYLYDPVERELRALDGLMGRSGGWEYENWEIDFAPKEKVVSEFLDILESRTRAESEMELNPGLNKKPRIVEMPQLKRMVHTGLERGRRTIIAALNALVPAFRDIRHGLEIFMAMSGREAREAVKGAILPANGGFARLWDFIAFSDYLTPDCGGPVVMAFRKVLGGTVREHLGQYTWILEHPEFQEVYTIVQAQARLARIFSQFVDEDDPVMREKMEREPHPLAFMALTLHYSARRFATEGLRPLAEEEVNPVSGRVIEVIAPAAWGILFLMDELKARRYFDVFCSISRGLYVSLPQLLLRELVEQSRIFTRDTEKMELVRQLKEESERGRRHALFGSQARAVHQDPQWGPHFESLGAELWERYLVLWWRSLEVDYKGYGAVFLTDEKRWERRVIGYEPYLSARRYEELGVDIFRDFYGMACPAVWTPRHWVVEED